MTFKYTMSLEITGVNATRQAIDLTTINQST
jgi:hypothetical protein